MLANKYNYDYISVAKNILPVNYNRPDGDGLRIRNSEKNIRQS